MKPRYPLRAAEIEQIEQAKRIAELEAERDQYKDDYFRRHKEATDNLERAVAAEAERDALKALLTEASRHLSVDAYTRDSATGTSLSERIDIAIAAPLRDMTEADFDAAIAAKGK